MGLFDGKPQEALVPLDLPQSCVGAPLPSLVADEHTLFVCYLLQAHDPDWDGSTIRMLDADSAGEPMAVLRVKPCWTHLFGPPNEEAIAGHRLAKLGLEPFAAFEVTGSAWIADLERANRVHRHHDRARYDRLRHFIFTFHDSVLEFVSEDFEVTITSGSVRDTLRRLVDEL
jgi:hypothetical protein